MTYEDCIEVLAGLQTNIYSSKNKFEIEKTDVSLINSLAWQTMRGIAYTDRQLDLVKNKINLYGWQLDSVDLDDLSLRMPLRSINRDKYVKIIEENTKLLIRIRFPFSKKLIVEIEQLKNIAKGYRHFSTYEHDFDFNETNAYHIVKVFAKKDFIIDQKLINYSEKVEKILLQKEKYMPGIYNFKIKNIPKSTVDYITDNYGTPNKDNLYIFKDRRFVFGLNNFDNDVIKQNYKNLTNLTTKIIERKKSNVFINSNSYTFSALVQSILELNRFPLLVVLPQQDAYDYLSIVYNAFKNIVDNKDCSVMFRLDNNIRDHEIFNMFIKEKELNNSVSKDTKIVYISSSKITKPLLQSDYNAATVLCLRSSRHNDKVQSYLAKHDLIIHYDTDKSPMVQFGAGRVNESYTKSIEEL